MALPMPKSLAAYQEPEESTELHRWRWTADNFLRADELGLFGTEKRIELIEGEIFVHMSPIGSRHTAAISKAVYALTETFGRDYLVRFEQSIVLPDDSVPQPDVCVVPYREDHYEEAHPIAADVLLLIEVSDSTLPFDRTTKAHAYGAAGIPEYWIVNLIEDRLEAYSVSDPEMGYRSLSLHNRNENISPRFSPERSISVSSLLPSLGSVKKRLEE
jgi:Uma2 family endonuclease